MLEVELKAALAEAQAAALPERLAALGFLPGSPLRETDVYWNGEVRNFRETDEALRLRRVENLQTHAAQALITYKGPKRDSRSNTRLEYETSVGSLETARDLLRALGFRDLFVVDKTRREFSRENISACLDRVDGLGDYLELEILLEDEARRETAVDTLLALLDQLGICRDALRRQSYLELLIAAATE